MQASNQSLVDQPDVLYRALNEKEIEGGNVLIPKSQEPFRAELTFDFIFPGTFGPSVLNALINHQKDGEFETKGVSTTFDKEIAFNKYGLKNKIIAVISRSKLKDYGIKEYILKDNVQRGGRHLKEILHPEDEEVVLVQDKDGNLPKEIIIEIIKLE